MKKGFLFLAILLPVAGLLCFSLTRDPRILPSALIGRPAPPFALKTMEGEEVSLAALAGRPVVLNFWSTWCGPCLAEHQLIRRAIGGTHGTDVAFYSVLYEDTVENAKEFVTRYGKGAPILLDPALRTAIDYGVAGVPETFFIDRNGTVLYKFAGPLTPEDLFEQLETLRQP